MEIFADYINNGAKGEFWEYPGSHKHTYNIEALKMFDVIVRRSLSRVMPEAKAKVTTVKVKHPILTEGEPHEIKSITLINPGFLDIWNYWTPETDYEIPEIKKPTRVPVQVESIKEKVDLERRPYVQNLIMDLESRGIGRPSSTANILDNLEKRGYVRNGMSRIGALITSFHRDVFGKVINTQTTSEMEKKLTDVAKGDTENSIAMLSALYKPFETLLNHAREVSDKCGKVLDWMPDYFTFSKGKLLGFDGVVWETDKDLLEYCLGIIPEYNWIEWGSIVYATRKYDKDTGIWWGVWKNKEEYIIRTWIFYLNARKEKRCGVFTTKCSSKNLEKNLIVHRNIHDTVQTIDKTLDYNQSWELFAEIYRHLKENEKLEVDLNGLFASFNVVEDEGTIYSLVFK